MKTKNFLPRALLFFSFLFFYLSLQLPKGDQPYPHCKTQPSYWRWHDYIGQKVGKSIFG